MSGRTLILEFHSYRGFGAGGGPLGSVLTLGFISVSWLPFLLSKWLRVRLNAMKNAIGTKDVPPIAEMSAWAADRPIHKTIPRGRT